MLNRVAIIDYGMCNLDSVRRAVEECGGKVVVTDDPADLASADRIILPGVGAFPDAMRNLKARSLHTALANEVLGQSVPFLGICLGMQMLATAGHEGGDTAGLGWIDGEVRRLQPTDTDRRVPHVGWNEVEPSTESAIFGGIPFGSDFYFVHSYHLDCADRADVAARTPYADGFCSAVERDLVFGVQFHPEKSQQNGFRLLSNFLAL